MRYPFTNSLLLGFFFLLTAHSAFAQSPLERVREKVDAIITIVIEAKKNQTLEDTATREKLWSQVDTIFDFNTLSQKSLSRNWLAMNDEEKAEFVELFRKLLGRAYLKKIESYDNEFIQYHREVFFTPENAEVLTTIESKGQLYDLNYRLLKKEGEWRIYDVSIEGVSLVSNYRAQFNGFLRGGTIQELLSSLKSKVTDTQGS
nr:ABC transporter substrate-binding protein [Desulfobulbaceae bacterium]